MPRCFSPCSCPGARRCSGSRPPAIPFAWAAARAAGHLNQFARNWHYSGVHASDDWDYFVQGTLPFSTVLPAVAKTVKLHLLLTAVPGFQLVTFDGKQAITAHVDLPKTHRVGKYGVDEIGKMECLSERFVALTVDAHARESRRSARAHRGAPLE